MRSVCASVVAANAQAIATASSAIAATGAYRFRATSRPSGDRRVHGGEREVLEPEHAIALVVAEHLERELVEVERAHPAKAALVEQREDVIRSVADRLAELAHVLARLAILVRLHVAAPELLAD